MLSKETIEKLKNTLNGNYTYRNLNDFVNKHSASLQNILFINHTYWGNNEDYPSFTLISDNYDELYITAYPGTCSTVIFSGMEDIYDEDETELLLTIAEDLCKMCEYSYILLQDTNKEDLYIELGYEKLDYHINKRTANIISLYKKTI